MKQTDTEAPKTQTNVDRDEIAKFEALANRWWDTESEFKPLHAINPLRANFIDRLSPVAEKKVIDIGCGGGILSEQLNRLGADVTGIDASEIAIEVAKEHSLKSRLKINYECISTTELIEIKKKNVINNFDLVIASEVIEHVDNRRSFLSDISNLCRSGGLVVFTTINTTS